MKKLIILAASVLTAGAAAITAVIVHKRNSVKEDTSRFWR